MAINFLPWRERIYAKNQRRFRYTLFSGLILMAVIFLAIYEFFLLQKEKINLYQQYLLKQIQVYQKNNKNQADFHLGDQKKSELLKFISELKTTQEKTYLFLKKLGEIEFDNFYLTQISLNENQKIVKGVAVNFENVFRFIQQLKSFPMMKTIRFMDAFEIESAVRNLGDQGLAFKLTLEF